MPQKAKHSYPISLQGVCMYPIEWKTSCKISQVNAHGSIIVNSKKKKKKKLKKKKKKKLYKNLTLYEAHTNHRSNLRRVEVKRKKEVNIEASEKETSNPIS